MGVVRAMAYRGHHAARYSPPNSGVPSPAQRYHETSHDGVDLASVDRDGEGFARHGHRVLQAGGSPQQSILSPGGKHESWNRASIPLTIPFHPDVHHIIPDGSCDDNPEPEPPIPVPVPVPAPEPVPVPVPVPVPARVPDPPHSPSRSPLSPTIRTATFSSAHRDYAGWMPGASTDDWD